MQRPSAVITILAVAFPVLLAVPAAAQCNPTCQGDFNLDRQVTVDEIIVAVNNALGGCQVSAQEEGCLASGGNVTTGRCCSTAPQFPDSCSIGACSCAPQFSVEIPICDCGAGRCFDRTQNACVDAF